MFFLRGEGVDVCVGRLAELVLYSRLRAWSFPLLSWWVPLTWLSENPNQGHSIFFIKLLFSVEI